MFDFLSNFQPVQLADPMKQAANAMSLAALSREDRMGREQEKLRQLDQQSSTLAANAYTQYKQTGDLQSVLSGLSSQGDAGAMATQKLVKFANDQQKSEEESAYKRAQTGELSAKADKDRMSSKLDGLKAFQTLGTAIGSGQAPVNDDTMRLAWATARQVLPEEVWRTMPAQPEAFKQWMTVASSPEAISKIASEGATAAKTELETKQMPAELKVKQDNSQSQRISANAAARSANTGAERLAFEKEVGPKGQAAPSGYRWTADGGLEAIPGGPAAGGKAPEAYSKQVAGITNLQTAIGEYQKALSAFGPMDYVNPDARAKMGTAYNNMMLQAKEAYNLGVLNGPDYDILQSVVADPTSARGAIMTRDGLAKQASDLGSIMQKNKANLDAVYKQQPTAKAPAGNRDTLVKEAMDAISRGADAGKVRARLKELGVEAPI